MQASFEELLSAAKKPRTRARLLKVDTSESGSWLNALPVPSLGLRMDDEVMKIAAGLCLGVWVFPWAVPMPACFAVLLWMSRQPMHGLSCIRSAGRHSRHAAINDLVITVFGPDPPHIGAHGPQQIRWQAARWGTIAPWRASHMLVWDVGMKLARWTMGIQDLDLKINHRPAKSNLVTDALSRGPLPVADVLQAEADTSRTDLRKTLSSFSSKMIGLHPFSLAQGRRLTSRPPPNSV